MRGPERCVKLCIKPKLCFIGNVLSRKDMLSILNHEGRSTSTKQIDFKDFKSRRTKHLYSVSTNKEECPELPRLLDEVRLGRAIHLTKLDTKLPRKRNSKRNYLRNCFVSVFWPTGNSSFLGISDTKLGYETPMWGFQPFLLGLSYPSFVSGPRFLRYKTRLVSGFELRGCTIA
jgi:hypothetical protein